MAQVKRGDGTFAYMVFDVVAFNGERVGDKTLQHRLKCIGEQVRAPFRDKDKRLRTAGLPPFQVGEWVEAILRKTHGTPIQQTRMHDCPEQCKCCLTLSVSGR